MTVQDTVRPVTVPSPAAPADPPAPLPPVDQAPAGADPAPAPPLGRERPLTADERQFRLAITLLLVGLMMMIIPGLLLGHYAVP